MIKSTAAIDRLIAVAAGLTTHRFASTDTASGRDIRSIEVAERRGLVRITGRTNLNRKVVQFELTDLGLERALERALELEIEWAEIIDAKTGRASMIDIIRFTA